MDTHRPSLLVFSDDWGRHPSSCQHLISKLLGKYEVYWVNTIGMRPPTLDLSTVRRAAEKLGHWVRRPVSQEGPEVGPAPTVLNPRMWPWFRHSHDRWLNRRLLSRQLNRSLKQVARPLIGITTVPIVADIMDELDVDKWIYYCVDDFGKWPGLDQHAMELMEEVVIGKADRCIAASEVLQQRLAARNRSTALLTHGVDLGHWIDSTAPGEPASGHSVATFWGLVDRRLDLNMVTVLNDRFVDGKLRLVGPQDHPAPELARLPRVELLPPVSYQELPQVAAQSHVLVMPYADLPVTRAMQPLKLLEYLATDRPVVARDLPATLPWRDCMDLVSSPEDFASLVIERVATGLPDSQRQARLERLRNSDWVVKANQFESLVVDGEL
ncbi:MAG: glycosyltransferase [Planctomycetales bacterium]|nr:glycosyltransferase [Planctomycetales bacterium]